MLETKSSVTHFAFLLTLNERAHAFEAGCSKPCAVEQEVREGPGQEGKERTVWRATIPLSRCCHVHVLAQDISLPSSLSCRHTPSYAKTSPLQQSPKNNALLPSCPPPPIARAPPPPSSGHADTDLPSEGERRGRREGERRKRKASRGRETQRRREARRGREGRREEHANDVGGSESHSVGRGSGAWGKGGEGKLCRACAVRGGK